MTAALPTGWTGNRISRAAQERGYTLSPTTVLAYLNGTHASKPSDTVLRAFADVLNIPITELRAAAAAPAPADSYSPPPQAHQLSTRQQAAVNELIRLLAEAGPAVATSRRFDGQQPTSAEVDAASAIAGLLAAAEELARDKLSDEAFANHLAELIDQLTQAFGRADLTAVEVTLPGGSTSAGTTKSTRQRA